MRGVGWAGAAQARETPRPEASEGRAVHRTPRDREQPPMVEAAAERWSVSGGLGMVPQCCVAWCPTGQSRTGALPMGRLPDPTDPHSGVPWNGGLGCVLRSPDAVTDRPRVWLCSTSPRRAPGLGEAVSPFLGSMDRAIDQSLAEGPRHLGGISIWPFFFTEYGQ